MFKVGDKVRFKANQLDGHHVVSPETLGMVTAEIYDGLFLVKWDQPNGHYGTASGTPYWLKEGKDEDHYYDWELELAAPQEETPELVTGGFQIGDEVRTREGHGNPEIRGKVTGFNPQDTPHPFNPIIVEFETPQTHHPLTGTKMGYTPNLKLYYKPEWLDPWTSTPVGETIEEKAEALARCIVEGLRPFEEELRKRYGMGKDVLGIIARSLLIRAENMLANPTYPTSYNFPLTDGALKAVLEIGERLCPNTKDRVQLYSLARGKTHTFTP